MVWKLLGIVVVVETIMLLVWMALMTPHRREHQRRKD